MTNRSNYLAIRDYNIIRTFLRHVLMLTWDPYFLSPDDQLLRIQNVMLNRVIDEGVSKPFNSFRLFYTKNFKHCENFVSDNTIANVLNKYDGVKYHFKTNHMLFLRDMVEAPYNCFKSSCPILILTNPDGCEEEEKSRLELIAMGKYIGSLPEVINGEDLTKNRFHLISFMREIEDGRFSFINNYRICEESILSYVCRFLTMVKLGNNELDGKLDITYHTEVAKKELEELSAMTPNNYTSKFAKVFDSSLVDYSTMFEQSDQLYRLNEYKQKKSKQMFDSLCDTKEYFAKGVIYPMLVTYLEDNELDLNKTFASLDYIQLFVKIKTTECSNFNNNILFGRTILDWAGMGSILLNEKV